MKILLLHQYYLEDDDHGGSRWNEITKQWTEEGHEVQVIAGMMHYTSSKKRSEYKGKWFVNLLSTIHVDTSTGMALADIKAGYLTAGLEDFDLFWDNKPINTLHKAGLLRV